MNLTRSAVAVRFPLILPTARDPRPTDSVHWFLPQPMPPVTTTLGPQIQVCISMALVDDATIMLVMCHDNRL